MLPLCTHAAHRAWMKECAGWRSGLGAGSAESRPPHILPSGASVRARLGAREREGARMGAGGAVKQPPSPGGPDPVHGRQPAGRGEGGGRADLADSCFPGRRGGSGAPWRGLVPGGADGARGAGRSPEALARGLRTRNKGPLSGPPPAGPRGPRTSLSSSQRAASPGCEPGCGGERGSQPVGGPRSDGRLCACPARAPEASLPDRAAPHSTWSSESSGRTCQRLIYSLAPQAGGCRGPTRLGGRLRAGEGAGVQPPAQGAPFLQAPPWPGSSPWELPSALPSAPGLAQGPAPWTNMTSAAVS